MKNRFALLAFLILLVSANLALGAPETDADALLLTPEATSITLDDTALGLHETNGDSPETSPHLPVWLDVLFIRPIAAVQVLLAGTVYVVSLPVVYWTDLDHNEYRDLLLARPVSYLTAPLGSY